MNAATRGVILAIAAVIIGVIVLGQGFDDQSPTLTTAPAGDDGSQTSSDDDASADDAGSADDGGQTSSDDDGDGGDDAASSDDGAAATDDGGDDSGVAADDSASTDGSGDDSTDTPSILHPPAEVRVLVANGTTVAGAAGRISEALQNSDAYNTLEPTNTTAGVNVDASIIYYSPGYELDARQIALSLNAPPGAVAPLPDPAPVDDLLQAHVLVVLGPDLVSS